MWDCTYFSRTAKIRKDKSLDNNFLVHKVIATRVNHITRSKACWQLCERLRNSSESELVLISRDANCRKCEHGQCSNRTMLADKIASYNRHYLWHELYQFRKESKCLFIKFERLPDEYEMSVKVYLRFLFPVLSGWWIRISGHSDLTHRKRFKVCRITELVAFSTIPISLMMRECLGRDKSSCVMWLIVCCHCGWRLRCWLYLYPQNCEGCVLHRHRLRRSSGQIWNEGVFARKRKQKSERNDMATNTRWFNRYFSPSFHVRLLCARNVQFLAVLVTLQLVGD